MESCDAEEVHRVILIAEKDYFCLEFLKLRVHCLDLGLEHTL
jgi:hypothetical protein